MTETVIFLYKCVFVTSVRILTLVSHTFKAKTLRHLREVLRFETSKPNEATTDNTQFTLRTKVLHRNRDYRTPLSKGDETKGNLRKIRKRPGDIDGKLARYDTIAR